MIDCSAMQLPSEEIEELLLKKEKLWINAGKMYGEAGNNFIRLNFACPRRVLVDGLDRLKRGLS